MSIKVVVKEFIVYLQKERMYSKHTISAYRRDIEFFFKFLDSYRAKSFSGAELSAISSIEFRAYLSSNSALSRSSIKRKLSVLHSFFKWLNKTKNIDNKAISTIGSPKAFHPLPRSIEHKLMLKIIADKSSKERNINIRNQTIITTIYGTGLRISELLALNIVDIWHKSQFIVKGKGGKSRYIPLLPSVSKKIEQYLSTRKKWQLSDPLFINKSSKRLTARTVQRLIEKLRYKYNLPADFTPHAIRHSFASALLNSGMNLRSIQLLLGHKDLSSTQIYTKVSLNNVIKDYQSTHPHAKINS